MMNYDNYQEAVRRVADRIEVHFVGVGVDRSQVAHHAGLGGHRSPGHVNPRRRALPDRRRFESPKQILNRSAPPSSAAKR